MQYIVLLSCGIWYRRGGLFNLSPVSKRVRYASGWSNVICVFRDASETIFDATNPYLQVYSLDLESIWDSENIPKRYFTIESTI